MEDYQKRVVEEKEELDAKIVKIDDFIWSVIAGSVIVDIYEIRRMSKQSIAMVAYSAALGDRILNFK